MSKKKTQPKKRKKKLRVGRLLIVLVLVIGIAAGIGNIYYRSASKAVDPKSQKTVIVEIPEGSTAKKIAAILKEKDLIKNKRVFVSNVKNTDKAEKVKAGKYKFSQSMNNDQIIDKLIKGQIYQDGIKVTIPEGSVSTEVVDALVKKGLGKRETYVKLFRDPKQFSDKYKFLNDKRIVTLEGFLYPETYFFKKGTSEKEVFDKMLSEFEKKYNSKVKASVEKNKLNFYDTVIMASIVEKEAIKDSERDRIAGVFYNRLDKKMRLQSDAVLQYALPERKSRVMYKDLKIESPYNLYLHDGLPPTPVANPGIKSLLAAANPEKTDYLYFVTGTDGENYYSKTFEEHKVHADKYRKELDEQEKVKQEKVKQEKEK
ncbi:endolytic transglycosylase MltG [Peptostreptococcus russellii]|uniref:endolytic transglycosylase MltG n=1 Tax=Peptostreptococcus russellii TaxID=215200 RepID=UPI0026EE9B9D|nr:endolytic transglycosylase MltG [Peptostreptococcus russellii]